MFFLLLMAHFYFVVVVVRHRKERFRFYLWEEMEWSWCRRLWGLLEFQIHCSCCVLDEIWVSQIWSYLFYHSLASDLYVCVLFSKTFELNVAEISYSKRLLTRFIMYDRSGVAYLDYCTPADFLINLKQLNWFTVHDANKIDVPEHSPFSLSKRLMIHSRAYW